MTTICLYRLVFGMGKHGKLRPLFHMNHIRWSIMAVFTLLVCICFDFNLNLIEIRSVKHRLIKSIFHAHINQISSK